MAREEIIKLAREAGFDPHDMSADFSCNLINIEHFAELVADAERNKLADWMMRQGYATGHGDSTENLLKELEWQIEERVRNEREACAKVCEGAVSSSQTGTTVCTNLAAAIRARGQA
jgi:hypothetical protein